MKRLLLVVALFLTAPFARAHYAPGNEYAITNLTPLPLVVETKGPVRAPAPLKVDPDLKISGQGFWRFIAAREVMSVPAEVSAVKQAHGTIIVDKATDIVYWGLQGVGWIGFSNKLRDSWVVAGNGAFTNGNLHGADILPQSGKPARIAAADNISGKIYLTDAEFQNVETLERPTYGVYSTNNTFKPTDVAFAGAKELWVVDGYGQQRFIPADVSPFQWRNEHYARGKAFSMTLHGVTYDKAHGDLLFSARPEGQLKRVSRKNRLLTEILALPNGTLLCDVDIWGDYALAACLDGPEKTAGPLYIINLKKRAIVSTIKPKDDLGYREALHLHDAAWYVTGKGKEQEVYILFTNWNPGGIGALKLVNIAE